MTDIGERIQQAMDRAGISQAELSRTTGISEGLISHYRSGKVIPKSANLHKIAFSLCVSTNWLMGEDESGAQEIIRNITRETMSLDEPTASLIKACLRLTNEQKEAVLKMIEVMTNA